MKYAAFISYRHGDIDEKVAELLHKKLETYTIPSSLVAVGADRSIGRVFRDREELPTSSDLSSSIESALRESEYLILICSRRTKESKWVMREIELFLTLRGAEKVILLLVDGEPKDSFPPQLCYKQHGDEYEEVEPLAADVRSDTVKGSLRRLDVEVLRILAVIIGCGFDDLRQRHKERRLRRLLTGTAIAAVILFCFGMITVYQYLALNDQFQQTLRNQSLVLAEYADNTLAHGDSATATLLAMEALPQKSTNPKRPYVPQAEFSLTKALGIYDIERGYKPFRRLEFAANTADIALNIDETRLVAMCLNQRIYVADLATGSTLLNVTAADSDIIGANAAFLADNSFVYAAPQGIRSLASDLKTQLWQSEPVQNLLVSGDGKTIVAVTKSDIVFFDINGTVKARYASNTQDTPALLAVNDNGTLVATKQQSSGKLIVVEQSTGRKFTPNDNMIITDCTFKGDLLLYNAYNDGIGYTAEVYTSDHKLKLRLPPTDSPYFAQVSDDGVVFAAKERIYFADWGGQQEEIKYLGSTVVSLVTRGNLALINCSDGSAFFIDLTTRQVKQISSTDNMSGNIARLGKNYYATAGFFSGSVKIGRWQDPQAKVLAQLSEAPLFIVPSKNDHRYLVSIPNKAVLVNATGGVEKTFAVDGLISMVFSPLRDNIVFHFGSRAEVYDASSYKLLGSLETATGTCIVKNGNVYATDGNVLRSIDMETGVISESALPKSYTEAWLDGNYIYGQAENGTWDIIKSETGECVKQLPDTGFLFQGGNPTDPLVIINNRDGVALYKVSTGQQQLLAGEYGSAFYSQLVNNGKNIAVGWLDRAKLFDSANGKMVADLGYENTMLTSFRSDTNVGRVVTGYTSAQSSSDRWIWERFVVLRTTDTYEPYAWLPGCYYVTQSGEAIMYRDGELVSVTLKTTQELLELAHQSVGNTVLTAEQRKLYRIE